VEVSEHIAALRQDGARLAAAAESAGLGTKVLSCPDWVVRDLVRHQGGVHRWATRFVADGRIEPWDVDLDDVVGSWPSDADLLEWFRAGHSALVTALATADPDLACWTFLPAPSPLGMWARRQAHETAVHRVDAELAAGLSPLTPIPSSFAADGIDELFTGFVTRRGGRLRADPPRTLRVACTDTTGNWLLRIGTEPVETVRGAGDGADCQVTGPASDLYLALWNREATAGLTVRGDDTVLALFLDTVHIRWT
jgi:uncharacterized protein (TIGR03083 family)